MHYQKYAPSEHLKPFVECYYVWQSHSHVKQLPDNQEFIIESPPTGFGSFVFNLGTPYSVETSQRSTLQSLPSAFLTGQATHQYRLHLPNIIHMVGIVFRPAGIGSLFGLPMIEFADERILLTDALGKSVQFLTEQLADAPNDNARIRLLEQFLAFQLVKRNLQPDRIDHTANLIVSQKGIINMAVLANDAFLCRRQFERKFLQRVGVSPKFYARIRRIGYLCSLLANQRWQVDDWQDLIYHCGYYDQSHFIRDFTEFTGKNPSLYVRNNVELKHYLSS
jgi:AraC-like DNA-binding protein